MKRYKAVLAIAMAATLSVASFNVYATELPSTPDVPANEAPAEQTPSGNDETPSGDNKSSKDTVDPDGGDATNPNGDAENPGGDAQTPNDEDPSNDAGQTPAPTTPEIPANAVYTGITMGDFADWNAVPKYEVAKKNETDASSHVAMVWDAGYVYLYIDTDNGDWNDVEISGDHSTGWYVIQTDLNEQVKIQLSHANGGTVNGVDGAECNGGQTADGGYHWQIKIPDTCLDKKYKDSISFGVYRPGNSDIYVSDVAQMNPASNGAAALFDGSKITFDGKYDDWEGYPVTEINYSTSGTHEGEIDGQGAMYLKDGMINAYVTTSMPQHLKEAGGEFCYAVTLQINGDKNKEFYPRFATVDESGNINWNPQQTGLPNGSYEYYVFDTAAWANLSNLNQLDPNSPSYNQWIAPNNLCYGKMIVTIKDGEQCMEYQIDSKMVANKFNMSADNIETVAGQWGRIGQDWINCGGTPTGAAAGIPICVGVCAAALFYDYKKRGLGVWNR